MKYCVVKDTTTVIDGSENSLETMMKNALNSGFTELEVEILTAEEYQVRKASEPQPVQPPTPEERLVVLEDAVLSLMME